MSMFCPPAPNRFTNEHTYNPMPVSNGQWRGAGQPLYNDGGLPPARILGEFANNFDYFKEPGSPFVSRDTLARVADRPMTGDPYHDRMTMLAREITRNPEMASRLDGATNSDQQDGLISPEDVHETMAQYAARDVFSSSGELGMYNGGMQRRRIENGYGDGGALNYSPIGNGMSPQNAEVASNFKNATDSDLAMELGNNFDYFNPNDKDKITQASLRDVASKPLTGDPVTDRLTLLALEVISRPGLNRKMDSMDDSDKPDRIIGRDTVDRLSK
ncbi:hypothetical protein [Pseudomonas rhodesiae]|uniref:hypothetical protein n=1 Tax=Pseudomonas rhodesiae TaxID=76760 RepID=UPI0032B1C6D9